MVIKQHAISEQQWEKLMAEKEEAIQDLERSFKRKLVDAETKFRYLPSIDQLFISVKIFGSSSQAEQIFFFSSSIHHFVLIYKFCMFLYTKSQWCYCAVWKSGVSFDSTIPYIFLVRFVHLHRFMFSRNIYHQVHSHRPFRLPFPINLCVTSLVSLYIKSTLPNQST